MVLVVCSRPPEVTETTQPGTTTTTVPIVTTVTQQQPMELTSPGFENGATIPARFTCDGSDVSPELNIRFLPFGTTVLAIIVDDPDAPVGTWDHWVEYDIEADSGDQTLSENAGEIGIPGVNSWNLSGYGGPCPPPGQNHRYFFTVFALDSSLQLPSGVDSEALRMAMDGHILAEAQLMGTYAR